MQRAIVAALAAALACAIVGCTSTETSVTAPTSDKCQITASNAPSSFTAAGGAGTVTIGAARDCVWSIAANAAWVSIAGSKSGQGDASIAYTVAVNSIPSARSTAIVVGSQTLSLSQAAAPCQFAISRGSDSIGSSGGRLTVGVSTLTGCEWTAASGANWIAVTGGQSGNANGTVELSVAANPGAARVAQVNIAGQTYTVNQDGAPMAAPAPTPSPTPGPTPSPTPTPTPTPGPAPPPVGGQRVSFAGTVTNASGRCPDLSFTVSSRIVITDKTTKFKDISCGDVAKGGRQVEGDGITDSGGAIHADVVTKAGEHD
jgi:all-beta uncharacterized protein/BACON domain-containing protein